MVQIHLILPARCMARLKLHKEMGIDYQHSAEIYLEMSGSILLPSDRLSLHSDPLSTA